MRSSYPQRQHNPPVLESTENRGCSDPDGGVLVCLVRARERFYLAERQIAELACYLALMGLAVIGSTILNYYGAIAPRKTVALSSDSCNTPTGREVYGRRLEQGRCCSGYDIHSKP
jgi:hypothetical protein